MLHGAPHFRSLIILQTACFVQPIVQTPKIFIISKNTKKSNKSSQLESGQTPLMLRWNFELPINLNCRFLICEDIWEFNLSLNKKNVFSGIDRSGCKLFSLLHYTRRTCSHAPCVQWMIQKSRKYSCRGWCCFVFFICKWRLVTHSCCWQFCLIALPINTVYHLL